jgi:squalene-hopene cyclase-like protein
MIHLLAHGLRLVAMTQAVGRVSGDFARALHPEVLARVGSDWRDLRHPARSTDEHLRATIEWLVVAHDKGGRRGVSAGYSIRHGWLPPYPETTGYIIPTFLDYAAEAQSEPLRSRAVEMALWEIEVQLPSGAVRSGVLDRRPTAARPAVFNTGQVMLGWCRVYRETGDDPFLRAAVRAGNWLVDVQSDDGAWRVGGGETATLAHAYDARTAWALLELFELTGDDRYRQAAVRQLDWVLAQQRENGWFANNAFFGPGHRWEHPFTHTIAYVLEGLMGAHQIHQDDRYVAAVEHTLAALRPRIATDGFLAGHFDHDWDSNARYSCLTGDAQLAGVLFRMSALTGSDAYRADALRLVRYVKGTQDLDARHAGLRGGIKGSHPIGGLYTPFVYVNWGAKFFADTLMLERRIGTDGMANVGRA